MRFIERYMASFKRKLTTAFFIVSLALVAVVWQSAADAATFGHSAHGTKKADEASPTSVSATFSAGATAGHMLIAVVGANGSATITGPTGWSQAINESGTVSQGIFYKSAAGGETTVSASVNANPGSIAIHIYEYSNATTFMGANSASGNSDTPTSGSVTTTAANELLFAAFVSDDNSNFHNGSWNDASEGFTERLDFKTTGSGHAATYGSGDNLTNAVGTHSVTVLNGVGNWRGQIVRFQGDTTAPNAVSDLAASNATVSTIDLSWTAPGDDGSSGTATSYDIRYSSDFAITSEEIWNGSTQIVGEPVPSVAGSSETFTVTGLNPNVHYYFAIKASDELSNVSGLSNSTDLATLPTPDTTAPSAVSDLVAANATSSSIGLSWTAPGDDGSSGTATSYDIRYSSSAITNETVWNAATRVTGEPAPAAAGSLESMTISGLGPNTTYYFAIKTSDEVPNVSALSNGTSLATLPIPDTTAPAAITNLALSDATTSSIKLTWTAPGDDGNSGTASVYDIHVGSAAMNSNSDFITIGHDVSVTPPTPAVAGTVQSVVVTGLSAGTTYYFAIRTYDEVPNLSDISNSPGLSTLTPPDVTPPAAVSDLALSDATTSSIKLTWTAPGDDGASGTAASYDIRYSTSPIDASSYGTAIQVAGEPAPSVAGTSQSMTVYGLAANTTYYFALKTLDDAPNLSALSNVPSLATLAAPDVTPPAEVSDLHVTGSTTTSITLAWTAVGDDGLSGTASAYDIRYEDAYEVTNETVYAHAIQVEGEPAPSSTGSEETMTVTGLTPNVHYFFALKVADEAPNYSGLSNAVSYSTLPMPDVTAPSAINDLAASGITQTSVTLSWTATGDDGATGTASAYDIHYSDSPILSDEDFEAGHDFSGWPTPTAAGTRQSVTVTGLTPGTTYYFAMEASDEVPNWADLSNVVTATTSASTRLASRRSNFEISSNLDLVISAEPNPTVYGGKVRFEYRVRNLGSQDVLDVNVLDDLGGGGCAPATYVSGDTDNDGGLDTDGKETWTFSCTSAVYASETHVAQASGRFERGGIYSNTSSASVIVGQAGAAPNIHLHAQVSPAVLHSTGEVATIRLEVGNIGDAAVTGLRFSGSDCVVSDVLEGDVDADGLLDPGERWVYSCSKFYGSTEGFVMVVTGTADGLPVSDTTAVTVSVGEAADKPHIHLHVFANPARLAYGGGATYITYHVYNDDDYPLEDVTLETDSETCKVATFEGGDVNRDGRLEPGEQWTFTCMENLTRTEIDNPRVRGRAGDVWVSDDAILVTPVATEPAPAEDPTLTGEYDPAAALAATPDIDTELGLVPAVYSACKDGVLYKLPSDGNPATQRDSTVYYCGRDGMLHAFPNAAVYRSWYQDYSPVRIVGDAELFRSPIGAPVRFRPGVRLVKRADSPKVYAISRGGTLRHLKDEAVGAATYGASWKTLVSDLPEVFWKHYVIGEEIP